MTTKIRCWNPRVLLAYVASALAAMAIMSPATGSAQINICLVYPDLCEGLTSVIYFECPGCPPRPLEVISQYEVQPVLPHDVAVGVAEQIAAGMALLDEAAVMRDLARREALRDMALDRFLGAAADLGTSEMSVGLIGVMNTETGEVSAEDVPWLAAAAEDIAEAMLLLQQALDNPEPQPWLDGAMEHLDDAYVQMVEQVVLRR